MCLIRFNRVFFQCLGFRKYIYIRNLYEDQPARHNYDFPVKGSEHSCSNHVNLIMLIIYLYNYYIITHLLYYPLHTYREDETGELRGFNVDLVNAGKKTVHHLYYSMYLSGLYPLGRGLCTQKTPETACILFSYINLEITL